MVAQSLRTFEGGVSASTNVGVASPAPVPSRGLRILVVDDCPEDQELFRRLLSQNSQRGYELIAATSGESALALCQAEQPDCMILDYRLPDLSGLEVLAELRGEGGYPVVPVVVLTGQGDDEVHERAMQGGAQDYLVKDQITSHHLWFSIRHAIERHRLMEALWESQAQMRAILATAPDGIITFNEDGIIESFNMAAESLFGYSLQAVIGQNIHSLIPDLHPAEGSTTKGEYVYQRGDGTPIQIEATVSHTKLGRRQLFTAIARDISERKRSEAELQDAVAQAEAASRARRDFIASASHDLRTPVHIMVGMLDMMLDTEITPDQRELLERAHNGAETLCMLSSDLLDFAKIDAGKVDLEPCDFDLRDLLADTLEGFVPEAGRKGLSLKWDVAPEVPATLVGVPGRLRQILTNLVSNGLKFTDEGAVTVRALLAENKPDRALLRFEVADTGIGLAPEMHGRLFQPFSQGDARHYEGTGLGLAICKKLVDLMNGQIGVESTRGRGSLFWFNLPMLKGGSSFTWP
jgi:PAS domain S-box-containing protein